MCLETQQRLSLGKTHPWGWRHYETRAAIAPQDSLIERRPYFTARRRVRMTHKQYTDASKRKTQIELAELSSLSV